MIRAVKFLPGRYRLNLGNGFFGQIKKNGRKWVAEIRRENGDLVRYAGIWRTLADAEEECRFILESM